MQNSVRECTEGEASPLRAFVSGSSALFSGRSQARGQMYKHALHSLYRKTNSQEDTGQKVVQTHSPTDSWELDNLQYHDVSVFTFTLSDKVSASPAGTWVTFGGQITDEVGNISLRLGFNGHYLLIRGGD